MMRRSNRNRVIQSFDPDPHDFESWPPILVPTCPTSVFVWEDLVQLAFSSGQNFGEIGRLTLKMAMTDVRLGRGFSSAFR